MAGSFARCICHSHIVQITVDSQQSCRLDWRDLLRIGYVQAVRGQCDGPDICSVQNGDCVGAEFYLDLAWEDRKSTRLNSSHLVISYAVFCLKKKQHVL